MRIILALVAIATIISALGIGLGLGLSHRERPGPDVAANSTVTNQVSAKPYHSMADDTAIAAVTLSNGNRQVFFQEESGYLRRALYSAEAGIWQTSVNSNLGSADSPAPILFAKNSTPLAAAVRRGDSSGVDVSPFTFQSFDPMSYHVSRWSASSMWVVITTICRAYSGNRTATRAQS